MPQPGQGLRPLRIGEGRRERTLGRLPVAFRESACPGREMIAVPHPETPKYSGGTARPIPGAMRPACAAPIACEYEGLEDTRGVDGRLQEAGSMRLAVGLGIAFAACGCADGGRAISSRTPADDPMPTRAAPLDDEFDEAVSQTQHITPPAEHPPSRSLGYLGDQPIGELPSPPIATRHGRARSPATGRAPAGSSPSRRTTRRTSRCTPATERIGRCQAVPRGEESDASRDAHAVPDRREERSRGHHETSRKWLQMRFVSPKRVPPAFLDTPHTPGYGDDALTWTKQARRGVGRWW